MGNYKIFLGLFGFCALSVSAGAALAATAGHAQFINGNVQITDSTGRVRALQKGDAVNEGDMITSAKAASAQIRMQDGGFVAVRPDTQLKFDQFNFKGKEDGSERGFFSLLKGGFRAVTGLIGRTNKENYRVTTPAATIGIRGTDHESFYAPVNLPGALAGAYSKVNVGETSLTTNVGTVYVKPNQMGYAGGLNQSPKLQPVNTNIFTVAPAPAKEVKKEEQKTAGGENGKGETQKAVATPGETEEVRSTAVVDSTGAAETGVAVAAPAAGGGAVTKEVAIVPPTEKVVPIELVDTTTGTLYNATDQTITSSTGQTTSIQNGVFATQAEAAAAAAAAAAGTQDFTLLVDTAPAVNAISSSTTEVTAATAINLTTTLATAAGNATSAQAAATTAAAQALAAQNAFTANGAFADATLAAPANTATQSAKNSLQTANTAVQAAAGAATTVGSVSYYNAALTTAQGVASTDLGAAVTNRDAAVQKNGDITSAQSTITNSQLTISNSTTAMQALQAAGVGVVAAPTSLQQAVAAAKTAADQAAALQAAGDFAGAQAALATAQAAKAIVDAGLAAYAAVNTAVTNAGTASTQAAAAQAAYLSANTALTASTTNLATVTTNASTVANNYLIAQYNNPAIAGNFIGHAGMPVPVAGGFNDAFTPDAPLQPNTQYVLDGGGNLVEMRNAPFQVQANPNGNVLTPSITGASGADIKWSGSTAGNEVFKLADNSIYAGRWVNPTITVTDNANTANVYTYTPAASLWAVLFPPPAGYVQSLGGTTTYTKAGNTTPVDAFGNLGVLNSASLAANFTSQLVNAAVNLTMSTGSMAGTFAVTANNMPIDAVGSVHSSGFGVPNAGALTTSCISGACAAGASGYSADIGGSFAGAAAASAGMSYNIWPTTALSSDPASNTVQGLVAFTTATPPTVLAAQAYVQTDVSFETSIGGSYYYYYDYYGESGGMTAASNVAPGANPPSFTSFTSNDGCTNCGANTIQLPGASGAVTGNATSFATTGIQFGRWTNAPTISQTSSYLLEQGHGYYNYSGGAASWAFAPEGYLDTPTILSSATGGANPIGVFNYALNGATTPQDRVSGATGTLNSMTLTADFTTQTISAALQVSLGATTWTANTGTVNFSGATFPNYGLNVTSNAACAVPPCIMAMGGNWSGAFTGQNYAGAIVNYTIYEYPLAGGLSTTSISGVAAMTRNGVAGNASVANGAAAPTGKSVVSDWWWGFTQTVDTVTASGGVLTGYGWNNGGGSTSSYTINCTTGCTGQAAPDAATGIQFGTWEAGTRTYSHTEPYGGPSHWIKGPGLDPIYLPEALLGTMTYSLDGGTAPTNQSGLTGTLSSASLAVNFTTQTVDIALGLTGVNGHNWTANSTGTPLRWENYSKNGFWAGLGTHPLVVMMDGATPANGYISGQLTGSGLNGALLRYQFDVSLPAPPPPPPPNTFTVADIVAGQAPSVTVTGPVATGGPVTIAFPAGTNGTMAPLSATTLDMMLSTGAPVSVTLSGGVTTGTVPLTYNPTLSGFTGTDPSSGDTVEVYAMYAAPPTPVLQYSDFGLWRKYPAVAGLASASATGSYSAGLYAGGTLPTAIMPVNYTPTYNANYSGQMVGHVQDSANNTPYILGSFASLNANLTAGTLTGTIYGITVTDMNTQSWVGDFNDLSLSAAVTANAFSGTVTAGANPASPSPVNVAPGTVGAASGHFYGPAANELTGVWSMTSGTILAGGAFGATNGNTTILETVNGTVALVAATPADVATPYRLVGLSAFNPVAAASFAGNINAGVVLDGGFNNVARVTEVAGNVTAFDSGFGNDYYSYIYGSTDYNSARLDIGTATPSGLGTDPATGISWGRWDDGTINITDRTTGVTTPSANTSLHWIAAPGMSAPVALPTTGTYNYVLAGGTAPTDNLGNVGTLNSATLSANFTAQTVNLGVNVGITNASGAATLNASASNVPIHQRAMFEASTASLPGGSGQALLTATCTGAGCGVAPPPVQAKINGAFTGATGAGAAMIYGFVSNGSVVNGVAAFRR